MAADIGDEQARDASGGAGRDVIDITPAVGAAERFAVDPRVEPSHDHAAVRQLVSAPHFHALHVMIIHDC
jgi:hypothetical protein